MAFSLHQQQESNVSQTRPVSYRIRKAPFRRNYLLNCLFYYHFIESHVKPVLDKFSSSSQWDGGSNSFITTLQQAILYPTIIPGIFADVQRNRGKIPIFISQKL